MCELVQRVSSLPALPTSRPSDCRSDKSTICVVRTTFLRHEVASVLHGPTESTIESGHWITCGDFRIQDTTAPFPSIISNIRFVLSLSDVSANERPVFRALLTCQLCQLMRQQFLFCPWGRHLA